MLQDTAIRNQSDPEAPATEKPGKATRARVWAGPPAAVLLVAGVAALGAPAGAQPVTETFEDPEEHEFLVPPNVCQLTVDAFGAAGGDGPLSAPGGLGGRAIGVIEVTPGETLTVNVGGRGGDGTEVQGSPAAGGAGGFNGGGDAGDAAVPGTTNRSGGGGGGASDVARGNDRLVVAGGGGGGGPLFSAGGDGGGAVGDDGDDDDSNAATGGVGGSQSAGGAGGTGSPSPAGDGEAGGAGQGGASPGGTQLNRTGGGGGGGLFGGGAGGSAGVGGGNGGGGGGGSGFGPDGVAFETGVREGDGLVTITYEPDPVDCAQADLALGKTATANQDTTVDFTLEATNNGPVIATGVVVTDALPECTQLQSSDCGGDPGPPFTWSIGELAAQSSASCTVTVDASGCAGLGEQTNSATVTGDQEDPDPENDTAEATFEITPAPEPTADLSLSHEATVNPAAAAAAVATGDASETPRAAANGDATVVFALQVSNGGPDDATGVVVTSELPECTQIVSDDCGGEAGPPWSWTLGNLAADASASCNLTVDAAQCSGAQSATAEVTADQSDPNPDDNTAAATFEIEAVPALPALALVVLAALLALAATRLARRDRMAEPPSGG